jgi:hypothetical protein
MTTDDPFAKLVREEKTYIERVQYELRKVEDSGTGINEFSAAWNSLLAFWRFKKNIMLKKYPAKVVRL